jgi:hypothetical protein
MFDYLFYRYASRRYKRLINCQENLNDTQQKVLQGFSKNFLNENEGLATKGDLFQLLIDESAPITYAQRLWDFFRGLFNVTISKIFELFKIEEECSSYISVLTETICTSTPIQGCET